MRLVFCIASSLLLGLAVFVLLSGVSRADNYVTGTVTVTGGAYLAGGFHVEVYNASAPFQKLGECETNESEMYLFSWNYLDAGYYPPQGHFVKIVAVNASSAVGGYYGETMAAIKSDEYATEYDDFVAYSTDLPTDPFNILTVTVSGNLGQPIAGATCSVEYSDGHDAQQGPRDTDENGVSNLTVVDGSYTLMVSAAHYVTKSLTIEIDHDMIQPIVLQLGRSSTPAPPFTLGVVGAMALMSFGLRRGRSV